MTAADVYAFIYVEFLPSIRKEILRQREGILIYPAIVWFLPIM